MFYNHIIITSKSDKYNHYHNCVQMFSRLEWVTRKSLSLCFCLCFCVCLCLCMCLWGCSLNGWLEWVTPWLCAAFLGLPFVGPTAYTPPDPLWREHFLLKFPRLYMLYHIIFVSQIFKHKSKVHWLKLFFS